MPFLIIVLVAVIVLLDPVLPLAFKEGAYALSLSIKSVIIFLLPWIIFGLLFKAAVVLSNSATRIIGIILALVCCSNFASTFLSHYVGEWIFSFNLSILAPHEAQQSMQPLWVFSLPKWIANDKAMFLGIILGIMGSRFFPGVSGKISYVFDKVIGHILKGIVYFIPLFVAGFVIKLQYDGVVSTIIRDYTTIFMVIAAAQFGYILLLYFLLSKAKVKLFLNSVKNMIPAALSGFSTMSSAASMPLTIIGAQQNVHNKDLTRSVIPATVNIHLIGDCFAIPIFAYAILKSYGMPDPTLLTYVTFTLYFVMAKFSVAAIPGGGILVMLPILEKQLGFNAEMLSLITALYILFDPVITAANVLGNGAFAKMIDRLLGKAN